MMKLVLVISALILSISGGHSRDLEELRDLFYKASYEQLCAEEFLNKINGFNEAPENTKQAYQAMAYMLLSKEAWNPINKYDYFQKGKNLLESAINKDPNNLELRYLRLCIQYNLPKILNYSNNIQEDQSMIVRNWDSISDADLKKKIKGYFIQNKLYSLSYLNRKLD